MTEDKNIKHIDYRSIQAPICEIPFEGEIPDAIEYCPSCIIDENAPKRNWWNEPNPYLEKSECEYYIPVKVNAEGKSYLTKELRSVTVPFNVFRYSYLRNGIRLALKYFDKHTSDEIVCAKLPEGENNNMVIKKQLYEDRELWNHLGKFSIYQEFQDKNGDKFRIQEPNFDLIEKFPEITNPMALEMFAYIKDYHLGNGNEPIIMLVAIPAHVFDQIPQSIAAAIAETEEEEDVDYNLKQEVVLDGSTFKSDLETLHGTFKVWQKYQALFYKSNAGRIKQQLSKDPSKSKNFYLKMTTPDIMNFRGAIEQLLLDNGYLLSEGKGKYVAEKIKINFSKPTKTKGYRIQSVEAKFPNCEFEPCTVNFQQFLSKPSVNEETLLNYIAYSPESIVFIADLEETPWLDWVEKYTYPKVQISYGDELQSPIPCAEATTKPNAVDDAMFKLDLDTGELMAWLLAQMNCKTLQEMNNYDPFKDINDLQNMFADLLSNFQFGDNDALNDLFGLPLDFAKLMSGDLSVSEILEGILSRVTVCNLMALLLEILKCIFSGFSLPELMRILAEKILLAIDPNVFKEIYNGFANIPFPTVSGDGDGGVEFGLAEGVSMVDGVAEKAKFRLGGFETPPWDYHAEIQEAVENGPYWDWQRSAYEIAQEEAPAEEAGDESAAETSDPSGGSTYTYASSLEKFSDGDGGATGDAYRIIDSFDGGLPGITASGLFGVIDTRDDLFDGAGSVANPVFKKPTYTEVLMAWVSEFINAILDANQLEDLLKQLENVRGGALIQFVLTMFGCPSKHFLRDFVGELKRILNMGHIIKGCSLGQPRLNLPPFWPKIDWLGIKDILRILLNFLIKKLIDLIAMLLLSIFLKILLALNCGNLKALFNWIMNGFELGDDGFEEAIQELCDDSADGDGTPNLDNLMAVMDNQGVTGNPEDIAALAKDISAGIPANDFKAAFLNPMELQDPDLMAQIANMVATRHPQHADVLGTPTKCAAFFTGIGNLLSSEQKEAIESTLVDDEIQGPMDPSICLTPQEKLEWDQARRAHIDELCGNLPMDGYRPGEEPEPLEDDLWPYPDDQSSPTLGDDWLDKLNDRENSNLDEFLDLFLNGPGAAIADALEEAIKPGVINCSFDPETGEPIEMGEEGAADNKSLIPQLPVHLSDAMDDAKATLLDNVENKFVEDLQGKYNSFFNHLFADTYNAPFYQGSRTRPSHDTLVKSPWIAPNAADTQEQWEEKWGIVKDRLVFPKFYMKALAPRNEDDEVDTDSPFPTNVYPKTIGLWMRDSLYEEMEEIDFTADVGIDSPSENFSFTRPYTRRRWGLVDHPVAYEFASPAESSPSLVLRFRDNNNGKGGGWNYGFDLKLVNHTTDFDGNQLLKPAYRVTLEELETINTPNALSFNARFGPKIEPPSETKVIRDNLFDIEVGVSLDRGQELLTKYYSTVENSELSEYTNAGIVLKNYIKNIYSTFEVENDISNDLLAKNIFESLNNYVYSNVVNNMLEHPDGAELSLPGYSIETTNADGEEVTETVDSRELSGVPEAFIFGYVNDNLTKADLTYVDTGASGYNPNDPDTWEYDHKNRDRVLGGSATGNKRVEFLDPAVHDMGKYTRPKIYIKPPKYTGWLALNQLFVPEMDNHAPKREVFLFVNDLIKKEKDLREEIPMDPRIDDPHACVQEGPYDVFSDPQGHSGCHVAVLAMIRTFVFEHMLKSMATYQMLKADYNKNFDQSVLAALVEDMEEELKDMPRRESKKSYFKGYSFWLLFLEQSVQTLERMIVVGDIKPTSEITAALEVINTVRDQNPPLNKKYIRIIKNIRTIEWDNRGQIKNIEFAYSRKVKGEKIYYPLEYDLDNETNTALINFLDSVMFYSLGRNFRNVLKNATRTFAYRMRSRQRRMFKMSSKLYAIHNSRETAKVLLRYLVGQQLTFYGNKLEEIAEDKERVGPKPKPHIVDLQKFFFGSSNTLITPLKGGLYEEETEYANAQKEASEAGEPIPVFDFGGDVKHVVHNPREENPIDYFSTSQINKLKDSPHGNFYIEKYLRIVDKPDGHDSETKWYVDNQKSIVSGRDDLLKGVVNIKQFQAFLKSNMTELASPSIDSILNESGEYEEYVWDTKISNVFGDATPIYEQSEEEPAEGEEVKDPELIGYDGSIGIRFGVRLCYVPKNDFDPILNYGDTVPHKSFLFNGASDESLTDHNPRKIFPLVSYERDIADKEIVNINLEDDNFGEDLKCYIHELLNTQEMDMVFNYCAPIKRASSLMALYSNYAFIPSVGEHPLERDINGSPPSEYWKTVILSKTKNSIRHLFIGSYSSVLYYNEKVGSRGGFGFKFDFLSAYKKLFMLLINPFAFFANLAASWGGFRKSRQIVDRPYDMYDNPEGGDDGVE